jgi:type I restriction enzyme S subunit
VKEVWKSQSFEECIEHVKYTNKIKRSAFLDEGAYPVVSQEEGLINGYWNEPSDVFTVKRPLTIFGDHTQTLKYIDFDFVLGADGVKILQPKVFLHPRFFYYQMQSFNFESLGYARHYRLLKEKRIMYPSLQEQKRIVAILDEAFEGIATANGNAREAIQLAEMAFDARIRAIFNTDSPDWESKSLRNVCTLQRGFDLPTHSRTPGPFPLVTSSGITDTHIEARVKGPGVVTGRSGSIGKVFLVEEDFWPLNTTLYVSDFHGNEPRFIQRLLVHFDLAGHATGTGVPTLNRNFVHDEIVRIPRPAALQRALADELDSLESELERFRANAQARLRCLDALKQSLLHQAFTGKL